MSDAIRWEQYNTRFYGTGSIVVASYDYSCLGIRGYQSIGYVLFRLEEVGPPNEAGRRPRQWYCKGSSQPRFSVGQLVGATRLKPHWFQSAYCCEGSAVTWAIINKLENSGPQYGRLHSCIVSHVWHAAERQFTRRLRA